MEQATPVLSPATNRTFSFASVTLAFQRMRQTWRMLCLVGLGMLASVIVVCAAPLYSQVAMTAGLRSALTASTQNTDIIVRGTTNQVTARSISESTEALDQEFQQKLGPYIFPGQFSLQTAPLNIFEPRADGTLALTEDQLGTIGVDTSQAGAHLRFVQGRMPSATVNGNSIEIAIRTETAQQLHWGPGTVVPARVVYMETRQGGLPVQVASTFRFQIVGVFNLTKTDDPFWHGEDFLGSSPDTNNFIAGSLASNEALQKLLSEPGPGAQPGTPVWINSANALVWYYSLNPSRIQISQVDQIINTIQTIQVDISNAPQFGPQSVIQRVQTYLPSGALNLYHDRLPIVQFPVMSLTLLVLALALFFVTLMTGILVDRQSGAMALLRSRGASGRQIFWSMVTQAVLLGLIALVVGPLLAILLVRLLAEHILTVADQGALNIVGGNPVPVVLSVGLYALATVGAMVLTMILAIWGAANRDVLALRRETARSTHRPFWQRLNLDAIAVIVALLGAGLSIYLTNSSVLDARTRLIFLSPLTLLEALCVLLAAMLLLMRGFPLLLRGGAWITTRLRGATSLIALAQMSRAPRQSVRMTLLLSLATAFTIFTLVFNASQTQRIQDVADYQAMADFSGSVPSAVIPPQKLASATSSYARLPGVLSASLGYIKSATAGGSQLSLPIDFKAVDGSTFAQTARWTAQDSTQSLTSLMRQLVAGRATAISTFVVPAIIDANAASELHLAPGSKFTLNFSVVSSFDLINLRVVAVVQHIPTAGNSGVPGIMADYLSFASAYTHNYTTSSGLTVPLNYVWLRTTDNPAQLTSLRRQLSQGDLSLSPLFDRREMIQQLADEPLFLTLFGILLLGATTALLLALIGNLVASWLNASSRLANFAALRALGATPRQIAGTLAWEQVIIYSTAMLLGFLFGWLLAILVLPSLVFTSILPSQISGAIDSQTFYAAQSTPPIQIVIPSALWLALGVLIALCIVALGMMVRIVSRPSISQVLRLNED